MILPEKKAYAINWYSNRNKHDPKFRMLHVAQACHIMYAYINVYAYIHNRAYTCQRMGGIEVV